MNVLFNQVKHIIEEDKKEYKGTDFCSCSCRFRKYCKDHKYFEESCKKHLAKDKTLSLIKLLVVWCRLPLP